VIKKYKIDAVLWVKGHEQLRQFLIGQRGWNEAYSGAYMSLYTAPGGPARASAKQAAVR
jgi:hypothetical protein